MNKWKSVLNNRITGFSIRLVIVYGLLIVPWNGFTQNYIDDMRSVIQYVYGADDARHNITVGPLTDDPAHPFRTRIVIVNNALMNPDGSGPIRNVDFDTMGMSPATLLIALVVATPVSWLRRGMALLIGIPVAYAIALIWLGFSIWAESAEIGLVHFTAPAKLLIDLVRNVMTTQLAITVPVLLWLVLIFRHEDFRKIKAKNAEPLPALA